MLHLQLELTEAQALALSHLVKQIPAHQIREWSGDDLEADAMRQALDTIRKALTEESL
jgi:hypothetical protein